MRKSAEMLEAGVARSTITPPRWSILIGYGDRFLGASGVRDELTATALVLTDGANALALIALDMLCLHEDVVARIRARVAERTPLSPDTVLIACSHTHAGPIAWAGAWSGRRRRRLLEGLVERLAETVAQAFRERAPAELAIGHGECDIAVNRRERKEDGRIELGVNPDGPVDRSLGVVQLRRPDGTLCATLVNFACHPTVLSPRNRRVSADWPGVMRREVERTTGAPCLFLQGATGDLNPNHEWGDDDAQAVEAFGSRVAAAVDACCSRGLGSVDGVPLVAHREEIALPVRLRRKDGRIESYRATGARQLGVPRFVIDPMLSFLYPWRPRLRKSPVGGQEMPMELQVLRIGDLVLVAMAAEVFNEIGAAIKAASSAPHTFFVGYGNGCIGYLPTAAAHADGGYEVEQAPLAYRISGTYDPGCEALVVKRSLDAARGLVLVKKSELAKRAGVEKSTLQHSLREEDLG